MYQIVLNSLLIAFSISTVAAMVALFFRSFQKIDKSEKRPNDQPVDSVTSRLWAVFWVSGLITAILLSIAYYQETELARPGDRVENPQPNE